MDVQKEVERIGIKKNFNLKKGMAVGYIINDPMKLSNVLKAGIFNEFYAVALSAFGQKDSEGFQSDVYKHLFNVETLILVFADNCGGKGMGFRTYSIFNPLLNGKTINILYLEGAAVKADYHSQGLYQSFTSNLYGEADYVAARTQNPVVVNALIKIFGLAYPITKKPSSEVKEIAHFISTHLKMKNYDYNSMVGKGTYGGILTGSLPRVKNKAGRKLFSLIDPIVGDSMIIICPAK